MPMLSIPRSSSSEEDAVILITKGVKFTPLRSRRDAAELAAILVEYLPGDTFDSMIDMLDEFQKEFHIPEPRAFFLSLLEENE